MHEFSSAGHPASARRILLAILCKYMMSAAQTREGVPDRSWHAGGVDLIDPSPEEYAQLTELGAAYGLPAAPVGIHLSNGFFYSRWQFHRVVSECAYQRLTTNQADRSVSKSRINTRWYTGR
jgi:hypothetical protein